MKIRLTDKEICLMKIAIKTGKMLENIVGTTEMCDRLEYRRWPINIMPVLPEFVTTKLNNVDKVLTLALFQKTLRSFSFTNPVLS